MALELPEYEVDVSEEKAAALNKILELTTDPLLDRIEFLEAELAKHAWHRIDPDDEATWPKSLPLNEDLFLVWNEQAHIKHQCFCYIATLTPDVFATLDGAYVVATHYRRIVGPGNGD